ncbi:(2Fe-2S)-binding protein [Luteithermobacter gelatinilyticus]|uniref:(2Fe-2S)-binding protein n=1 Tax=Luteithermobacter gelatinilyticus TaxID=2582913 RepID=UPI0011071A88|nr:ferredoxin [Luteithermobacter gelatinilyticus]|tara:strand:- start:3796 stop:4044 length:249 start_codon:yes stop_codon:yes gene_type:complete
MPHGSEPAETEARKNSREQVKVYICICNGLNENAVREAARNTTPETNVIDLYKSMGVKPQCGLCLCEAENVCQNERQAASAG